MCYKRCTVAVLFYYRQMSVYLETSQLTVQTNGLVHIKMHVLTQIRLSSFILIASSDVDVNRGILYIAC